MGYRLSKIYTGTGDLGKTGLGTGTRVAKDHARVQALGEIDELNCWIGLVLTENISEEIKRCLENIQNDLFDFGAELSIPEYTCLQETQLHYLETQIDHFNTRLLPLKEFVLPGGERSAALAHLARAVCRRAERSVIGLSKAEPVSARSKKYINRLSDLLFVLARVLNQEAGVSEILWRSRRNEKE